MPGARQAPKREVQQQERLGAQGQSALELADEVALNRLVCYCRSRPEVVYRILNLIEAKFFEGCKKGGPGQKAS
eukprot:7750740-Lingulodinium_polyedra.AAC.1